MPCITTRPGQKQSQLEEVAGNPTFLSLSEDWDATAFV